jgi:acetyl/propionyl-CoA carboxylase alpha subunit/acetyl-CoA carboxylase carboxyltransferase component
MPWKIVEAVPVKFERIAIVNRGEPAMRLINAVRDHNLEFGSDLRTIALFTDADRDAMFVREADEAFELGPAVYVDGDGKRRVGYLDYVRLEQALVATAADAAWAGWGFVAEHPEYTDLCRDLGVIFLGPSGDVMRRLGDKIASKRLAEEADVPVVPWSGGAIASVDAAHSAAVQIGYPLMIKATAGGGGRGIRRVDDPAGLEQAFRAATSEALTAFGNGDVFMEKLVAGARHVEVQIIGDGAGTVWALGVRDCSVQRHNQKIIEEAPSPALTADQHAEIIEAAARIGRAAAYTNVGTVEFLFDPESQQYWFMEVNARLQVEHPITELTTGVDLVKLQLHVAGGGMLEGEAPPTVGHAIEVRLNAEDPDAAFAPAPGKLQLLRFPNGPGIRIDTGVEEGDTVAPEFDSMIAKIMAHGRNRAEALSRLRRALSQTSVVLEDGTTNKAFLQQLLASPEFAIGAVDIGWVDGLVADPERHTSEHADIAIVAAAIAAYDEETQLERDRFRAAAARGRPEVDDGIGHSPELGYLGNVYDTEVRALGTDWYEVEIDGETISVVSEEAGPYVRRLICGGVSHRVLSVVQGMTHLVEVGGIQHRITHDEGGVIRAPAPSVVVSLSVREGDEVAPGDRLAVIEAMKMETTIAAPFAGRIREVVVRENVQVPTGAALLVIDPLEDAEVTLARDRVDFTRLSAGVDAEVVHESCVHHLERVRQMLLGYDVDPEDLAAAHSVGGRQCGEPFGEAERRLLEDEILAIFADIVSLFRRDPVDEEFAELSRRSTEEYLFSYLRVLGSRSVELPDWFTRRLVRTLEHYGCSDTTPPGELQDPLFRIAKSHDRMERQLVPVLRLLDHRLETPSSAIDGSFRGLLDRILVETRDRFPAVRDLAREVHYRTFDQPFLDEIKHGAYAEAERRLDLLAADPDGPERAEHILALLECPQSLTTFLSGRFAGASEAMQQILVEVMTRRYYRIRRLDNMRSMGRDGFGFAAAEYDYEGKRIHVLSTHVEYDELTAGATVMSRLLAPVDPEYDIVADFYVWRPVQRGSVEETRDEVQAVLDETLGSQNLRRIVVAVSSPQSGTGIGGVLHFTFRPDGNGRYREETVYRDLHPMMGKRLELWRLQNFDVRRLPTLADIYLFQGAAHEAPDDERLFALAEVRDLTPILDENGNVERLPDFERMYHDVLGAIRRIQAHRPARKRFQWNRVVLHIWPVLELSPDEMSAIVDRLSPETEGLGLEKVVVNTRVRVPGSGDVRPAVFEISNPTGRAVTLRMRRGSVEPLRPRNRYEQTVVRLRERGLVYPYEIISMLAPQRRGTQRGFPPGDFTEYDLSGGRLVPVDRHWGENSANIVVGVIENTTSTYPNGMMRVIVLGDPSRGMGNLAEAECSRIMAALDLAEELGVPLEWFAVSAGALISMESGSENMDWIARVLRRLIEYTQAGGEVNLIVTGINVGAQPYWNAEATMLMHTKGILIMTPESAMVLTGKQALDYSGGVSAEDNQGIGGYERIMGPNGQAQYFAPDLSEACRILLRHYEHTYVAPGERFPRRAETSDPIDRNIEESHHGGEFHTVGEVFSEETNPGRKKPFDIRSVMAAAVDRDHPTMERWYGMEDAEIAVVWEAHIGGYPVCLLGIEAKAMPRVGFLPADGPDQWTSGTLFPMASKKVARAVNAASGNRPLVVLANLSGFDGSPESMRRLQLEYGAEIGRAVVNFEGPIVFCVVSRYHGGAFVVFSNTLNDNMEVVAVEGAHASVIGGAPAAAVVFAREVRRRTIEDQRIVEAERRVSEADGQEKSRLRAELQRIRDEVNSEKLGAVADEFDQVHSVDRALRVGSVQKVIPAAGLRPYLVDAIERGMRRELERVAGVD